MKTYLDYYPCFMRQVLNASRRAGASEALQRQILLKTMDIFHSLLPNATPPEIAYQIHQIVRQETKMSDPYKVVKKY